MTEYTEENLNMISMKIILHAGDARNQVKKALDNLEEPDFVEAEHLLVDASEKLKKAHEAQTKAIQDMATGAKIPYSVLFSHAQDTLMTVMSEYNIAKQLVKLFSRVQFKEE